MPSNPRRSLRLHCLTAASCAAVLLAVALLAPAPAVATTLLKLDTVSISRRAARILVGTVVSTESVPFHGGVRTRVTMTVTDAIKDGASGTAAFYVPGGQLTDGRRIVVDGMATFSPGESACVFVDSHGWVVGGRQGKVALSGGRIVSTGQPMSLLRSAVKAAIGTSEHVVLPQGLVDPVGSSPAVDPPAITLSTPVITSIGPAVVSAGTNSRITISGNGFGASRGTVSFYYQGESRILASTIDSWSDTQIVCVVPVGTVDGYAASAGSGPVKIKTSGQIESVGFDLGVSFGYGSHRWPTNYASLPHTRVTYRVNPGGVSGAKAAIDAAASTWSGAGADFRYVDGGTTTAPPFEGLDGHNDIGWASGLPDGVIAQAWFGYDQSGNLDECNIEYSTSFVWGNGSGNTMDIQSIGLHEIGHWLSLRDMYGPNDTDKVMFGFSSEGIVKRTLTAGDLAGIRWIYGSVAPAPDMTAPFTTSNAVAAYAGTATISFSAIDSGSGVAHTYHTLDGSAAIEGATVAVGEPGRHALAFWSIDASGNVEATRSTAFTVYGLDSVLQTLTKPSAPSTVRHGTSFTVSGHLHPRFPVGTKVSLRFYHLESGHWKWRKTVTTTVYDFSTYSRYAARLSVPSSKRWRVRAFRSSAAGGSFSAYEYFNAS